MTTSLYIDANAYRIGNKNWKWSSYGIHIGKDDNADGLWTPTGWYKNLGDTPKNRHRVYAEMFASYVAVPKAKKTEDDILMRIPRRPGGKRLV